MSSLGMAFQVFAVILLPTLLFLRAATFGRVLESSIEDYFYLGGINRIHHFYAQGAPEVATYFVSSPYDDRRGRLRSMGSRRRVGKSCSPGLPSWAESIASLRAHLAVSSQVGC
jgi:hypothetical protein